MYFRYNLMLASLEKDFNLPSEFKYTPENKIALPYFDNWLIGFMGGWILFFYM